MLELSGECEGDNDGPHHCDAPCARIEWTEEWSVIPQLSDSDGGCAGNEEGEADRAEAADEALDVAEVIHQEGHSESEEEEAECEEPMQCGVGASLRPVS